MSKKAETMDEYDAKFAEMQKYIPFLEAMIERLQKVTDKSREVQLQKMQQLHGILSSNKRKLKIETLQRCEDVLQKLHSKVEKGTSAGLNLPNKKNEPSTTTTASTASVTTATVTSTSSNASGSGAPESNTSRVSKSKKKMDETPASPSPPSSPVPGGESASTPIIIPTERTPNYGDTNAYSKPASPDHSENVPIKAPIIIPTERKDAPSATFKPIDDSSLLSQEKSNKSLVNNGALQEQGEIRPHKRHIPTIPIPSVGSRRYASLLEKNHSVSVSADIDKDLKKLDVSKPIQSSDSFMSSKSTPSSLLVSPPHVLTAPPLSMEDIAELLNDDGSNSKQSKVDLDTSKSMDKSCEVVKKPDKETGILKNPIVAKDSIEDLDSERRWEEVDKHIVKLTGRKVLPNAGPLLSPKMRGDSSSPGLKPSNSQSNHPQSPNTNKKSGDSKNQPASPMKNTHTGDLRYADNYERHPPRPPPPNEVQNMPDINVIKSAFSRLSEGDIANLVQTNIQIQTEFGHTDDRNQMFRRNTGGPMMDSSGHRVAPQEQDYRRDNPDFYNMHHPDQGAGFCDTQWRGSNPNMRGHPNGQQMSPRQAYQHPNVMHQEMWNMGPNYAPNQFGGHNQNDPNFNDDMALSPSPQPAPLIPPLMSGPSFGSPPHYRGFPAERHFDQSFERPGAYPHAPARQEQWDRPPSRPGDPPFDRPGDFPHGPPRQQWEPNRPPIDRGFDRPDEYSRVPVRESRWDQLPARLSEPNFPCDNARGRGIDGSYGRSPSADMPSWSSNGADVPNRGRGTDRFPADRNRPGDPSHLRFNRRSEWDVPPQGDTSRFGSRDPRFRNDHPAPKSGSSSATAPRRDPRLLKDVSPQNSSTLKTKDTSATSKAKDPVPVNKRDPRRRNSDSKEANTASASSINKGKIGKDPPISHLSPRRNSLENVKPGIEKLNKDTDTMQSPLESLYGAIDTSAKTGKGYGIQKFKIPKIKRPEPIPRPPTPPKPSNKGSIEDESWDPEPVVPPARVLTPEPVEPVTEATVKPVDDKKIEVTSTTEESTEPPTSVEINSKVSEAESMNKETENAATESGKKDPVDESEATVDTSTSATNAAEVKSDAVSHNSNSEIHEVLKQGLLETLRKTFESTVFRDGPNLLRKLGVNLHEKKYKKIQKIINSDLGSSSDAGDSASKKDAPEKRKVLTKKKRRVIVSDSSDEDDSSLLADRRSVTPNKSEETPVSSIKNDTVKKDKSETEITDAEKAEMTKDDESTKLEGASDDRKPIRRRRKKKGKPKKLETTKNDDGDDDNDTKTQDIQPVKKTKRRRNSLDMLHEDIREMFICDDVVAATGQRSRRVIKTNLRDSDGSGSSSPARRNESASEDESNIKLRSRNNKKADDTASETGRPRTRGNSKRRKNSKDLSSGGEIINEDNQSLVSRNSIIISENSDVPKEKHTSPTTSREFAEESNRILRRSGRVAFKEPRIIIEKTEMPKIESSKAMFDTSSDESFGIDVSELTAAVDISLHSERQTADETSESIVNSLKKIPEKKKATKKRNSNESSASKTETPASFDDDAGRMSDVSTASTNASTRKASTSVNTNDELLSNIVGELVNNKKDDAVITESEPERASRAPVPKKGTKRKRAVRQKKKRRTNQWQMGIVPKTKKKKGVVVQDVPENLPIDSAATDKNDESPPQTISVNTASIKPVAIDTAAAIKPKPQSKVAEKGEEEKKIPTKINADAEEVTYPSLSVEKIMEYAWTGQERYDCLLCSFVGKNIVYHYKSAHPRHEMMISRLTFLDAKRAIDESKDEAFVKLSEKSNTGSHRKFSCRFCGYTTEGVKTSAMEDFYEHCTTHTGEYRFTCNYCGYQAIAKSTMKAHYYKSCRKNSDNIPLVITEDKIPSEEYIPGYLCSICHFLQLREVSVKKHIEILHNGVSDAEIVKVNMSGYFDVKDNVDLADEIDEELSAREGWDADYSDVEDITVDNNTQKSIENANDEMENVNVKPVESTAKADPLEDESENSLSKKLSAFVCPPELDNKEVEIQMERKKKMQEILKDIGSKYQKNSASKGLSIIDQLKDKMTTSVELPSDSTITTDTVTEAMDTSDFNSTMFSQSTLPIIMSVTSQALINQTEDNADGSADNLSANELEKKLKDPLATLQEGSQKGGESELEISDVEPTADLNRPYDFDSSDEISDTDIPADVKSLLKDAETINISTNAPMMTTIQRLAAQLQSTKSISTGKSDTPADEKDTESLEALSSIQQSSPIITTVSSLSEKTGQDSALNLDEPKNKNFIRLRRLSGDKLSIPDPTPTNSSNNVTVDAPSVENNQQKLPSSILSPIPPSNEEECSFLKIENVVSLASGSASLTPENSVISNIRKAVETPAVKSVGMSVLKTTQLGPNILKKLRPVNAIEGLSPHGKTVLVPKMPGSGPKGIKIVKVMRGLTPLAIIKPKEQSQVLSVPKFKTAEAFNTMLTPKKLRHLYKCMSRTCTYSTDSIEVFGKHFQDHALKVDRQNEIAPYDYEKCSYCTELLSTWEDMRHHCKTKHSFCAYQCNYCFYRAFTQSYVELHQNTMHPGKPLTVILGMKDSQPTDTIDRRENVIPFVCKHECNKVFYVPEAFIAHLKTKHGATLSIFKCHLCPATTLKAEQLIIHYKLHGLYKFQCLYCLFGADAPLELHHHLSAMHCNRPPKILERSLPPSPARDRDVLLQLIIRNLDEAYKCSELKIISSAQVDASSKLNTMKNSSTPVQQIPAELRMSGKTVKILPKPTQKIASHTDVIDIVENEKSKTSAPVMKVPTNTSETFRASPGFCDPRGISLISLAEKPSESQSKTVTVKITDKTKDVNTIINSFSNIAPKPAPDQHEPELELRYINEQTKTKIDNAIDPLSLPDNTNLDCSDEFISINVLDNPEILKSAEQSAAIRGQEKTTTIDDDDSDIEIIEHIQHTDDRSRSNSSLLRASTPNIDSPRDSGAKQESKNEQKNELENKPTDNLSICLNSLTTLPENFAYRNLSDDPMTLEDIKHTGFTGRDLYKCGNEGCKYSVTTGKVLKVHLKDCPFSKTANEFVCVHCRKVFQKIGFIVEHLKLHGLKRFGCVLCLSRFAEQSQILAHMKMKHRVFHSKVVPADPTNPSTTGLFIVYPVKEPAKKSPKKGSPIKSKIAEKEKEKEKEKEVESEEKLSYSPAEIASLPRQAIYNREVQCAVCPYTTKVRTNIIRHLQLHAKDETVPELGPVNPVPCLDKKERMFDKMVNLASSSHQNGRMGGGALKETVTASEVESVPKYVPEQKRYVCGVTDCNYLTVDETMLRCHLKTLHPDELVFRCPHCPPSAPGQEAQSIAIEKIGVHLKMHDTKLYKCSHCNHHHYHRHVVERHLADKHPEKRPFVKVIREMENTEITQQPAVQEEAEEGPMDRDGNYWKCNFCDYKCVYKSEMSTHTTLMHNEKSQFKCLLCTFKTNAKINLEQHFVAKHVEHPDLEYTLVFERIKGTKKPMAEISSGKQQVSTTSTTTTTDEPFDTTPLWRRDMSRVRYIRGILVEDETTPKASGKRKSDTELVTKPAKLKVKLGSMNDSYDDMSKSKNEPKEEQTESPKAIARTSSSNSGKLFETFEELAARAAQGLKNLPPTFGIPNGNLYVCCVCSTYKSKFRADARDHIYRELKYWRWQCRGCGYVSVSHSQMTKHSNRQHKLEACEVVEIPKNHEIEEWVQKFLAKQLAMMRGLTDDTVPKSKPKSTRIRSSVSPPTITLEDTETLTVPSSTSAIKNTDETAATVDLTAAISKMTNPSNKIVSDSEADDDDDALIIDSKEESADVNNTSTTDALAQESEKPKKSVEKESFTCKHCQMAFNKGRGLKFHVQVYHLKRLGFLCPYCDRSTNSEGMMGQHIRTKHPGLAEKIIHNPSAGGPDLTDDFWEKEYGIVPPKKTKKRKRKPSVGDEAEKSGVDICSTCGFSAVSTVGLRVHMRSHDNKHTLKCVHCSFTGNTKSDVWQHSEKNHPNIEWRAEEINIPRPAGQPPQQYTKSRRDEDYSKDIEEEQVPETIEPKFIHGCFYCHLRSSSLESVKKHWASVHKDVDKESAMPTGVPFRCKEIPVGSNDHQKLMKCAYCPKKGALTLLRSHSRRKHANMPMKFCEAFNKGLDLWVCNWCDEFCEGSARTSHHNMFHSHLPVRFKKKQEMQIMQRGYACPECSFVSVSLSRMKTHVAKHYDTFRCKRCTENFPTLALATQHSTREHPSVAANIEGYNSNVDLLMARVSEADFAGIVGGSNEDVAPSNEVFRNLGVAKKSTTRQLLRPSKAGVKAVARKSTTPRYPSGTRFPVAAEFSGSNASKGYSFYGQKPTPVDLANLNTTMTIGCAEMKVKCTTLAQVFNINGRVVLKDVMKDKSAAMYLKKSLNLV